METPTSPREPVDATLRSIMEGTASARGEHFFRSLVQYLAISLGVKSAFVAQFVGNGSRVQTLALWIDGEHHDNVEFDVAGTPCQGVLGGAIQHFGDDVQSTFPDDAHLRHLSARSYLAIPLTDDSARVVGHLAVIDDKPMQADDRELSIFHIFAARATAELMRRRTEEELDASRQHQQRIEAEVAYLREELRSRSEYSEIVGESAGIWKVLGSIDRVASTDSTVLILGETGTGKELVAKAVHVNSKRSRGPFVRVNCAALPESLLESELFGHELGAFTGATQQRSGRFELADGGTIFLDEIGEMPLAAQSRLLRVLQEQELERVGGSQTIRIDTRVLAATNRDLLGMVGEGRFREDLYYRLNVFPITLPPLRERLDDIPTLVRFFLEKLGRRIGKQISEVPESVFEMLRRYHWPGNIRELENIVERAMILSADSVLRLPEGALPVVKEPSVSPELLTLDEIDRKHIVAILERTNGVVSGPKGAAKILGLKPNTLRSRMAKLGIR